MVDFFRPFADRSINDETLLSEITDPFVRRIFLSRNVKKISELDLNISNLLHFSNLKDIDRACSLLYEALSNNSNIVIVGDYDVDGATSTTLAIKALKNFGAKNVDFFIPDRVKMGYGLTPEIVDIVKESTNVDLLITVDNGITSFEGVNRAHELGIKVLVTDHHLSFSNVPDADAIVNPNQTGCSFASKNLAGVGVIFYVMVALRSFLREKGWFLQKGITEPKMNQYLDLVAVGSVADVVTLDQNNRILIKAGLERIRANKCIYFFTEIIQRSKRILSRVNETDICFSIAPLINAVGRIDNMSLGVKCLLSNDPLEVNKMINEITEVNQTRRAMEAQMQLEAVDSIQCNYEIFDKKKTIVIFKSSYHQGIVGLVASRIKDIYYKPTVVFATSGNGELKGSARTIDGLHIKDVLEKINLRYPGSILKFGGHAMAAGLTIKEDKLDIFTKAFEEVVFEICGDKSMTQVWYSDGCLPINYLTVDFARYLESNRPWGNNFPSPSFDGEFFVKEIKKIGENNLKLTVTQVYPNSCHYEFQALLFKINDKVRSTDFWHRKIRLGYKLEINEWRGISNIQLVVENVQLIE